MLSRCVPSCAGPEGLWLFLFGLDAEVRLVRGRFFCGLGGFGCSRGLRGHRLHDPLQVVDRRELHDDLALVATEFDLTLVSKTSESLSARWRKAGATGLLEA